MDKHLSNLSMTTCGRKFFVWVLLVAFGVSSIPSAAFAQQAVMTISALDGTALVNGQETTQGAVLSINDIIETQASTSLVLTLSDGSTVSLGENTKVDLAELSQAATGVRVSRMKLLWGRVRAVLSPEHQQTGSTFDIETPNALIGVKFSQPDVEVIYDLAQEETIGIAHTVELIAINLLTNERIIVPVGSTVTIAGMLMTIVEGTTTAAIAAEAGGIALTTKTIAIGAGALVGLGGLAVVASGGGGDDADVASDRCDALLYPSSDGPETRVVAMDRNSGTFDFYYVMDDAHDQMVVEYEGQVLHDTGCVSGRAGTTVPLYYSGKSNNITVRVTPMCAGGRSNSWKFRVYCPR